jgi:hypothetical protein
LIYGQELSWKDPNYMGIDWENLSWDNLSWDNLSWDNLSWDNLSWDAGEWDSINEAGVPWETVIELD